MSESCIKVHTYSSEIHKTKMKEDPEYRAYVNNLARLATVKRYQTDEAYRERRQAYTRNRYQNDPEFREKRNERARLYHAKKREEKKALLLAETVAV